MSARSWRAEWARWVAACTLSMVLIELTVRALLSVPEVRRPLVHAVGPRSSELGWLYIPAEDAPPLQWDAERGWANRPGQRVEWGYLVSVDPSGVRAPAPPRARAADERRVAVLGDSFAFGSDMADDRIFPHLFDRQEGVDVVNLGVPGYEYGQMLLTHRLVADAWDPTHVLICLNDVLVDRTVTDFFLYVRPMIPAERGLFTPTNTPVPSPDVLRASWAWRSRAWALLEASRWQVQRATSSHRRWAETRSEALLRQLIVEVQQAGRVPWLVYLPLAQELGASDEIWATKVELGWMRVLCADPGVWCTPELAEDFRAAHRDGVVLGHGAHWSEPGHRLVAEALERTWQHRAGAVGASP